MCVCGQGLLPPSSLMSVASQHLPSFTVRETGPREQVEQWQGDAGPQRIPTKREKTTHRTGDFCKSYYLIRDVFLKNM